MISIKNVSKNYINKNIEVNALKGINVDIEEKKVTAIIGRSGSGKSTLLNIIGALDTPSFGEIYFEDRNISNLSQKELLQFRNSKIGYIFQSFYLESNLTVLTNIVIPLMIKGIDKKEREAKALELMDRFGLTGKEKQKVSELSGGERQRVCICRALISNPDVILADEPTGNLDFENGQIVLQILKEIALSGKIVVLVTHNLDDAKMFADRIIKLSDGQIVEDIINEN